MVSTLPPSEMPPRVRRLMNMLGAATLVWTAYSLYAWATHSGTWRITWDTIASHQRAAPDSLSVAFISWGLGLAPVLIVGWPTLRLLQRGRHKVAATLARNDVRPD